MKKTETQMFSALPSPFAQSGDRNIIGSKASTTVVNKATGIPPVFATDIMSGGKFIQRKDLNGMAHLLSLFQYYMQVRAAVCFDKSVCEAIGGYPEGAVLAYVNEAHSPPEMYFIESTKDDNTDAPVPNVTIDAGSPADYTKPWHKLTPSWEDIDSMDMKVKVVDKEPLATSTGTFYFVRGEGVSFD